MHSRFGAALLLITTLVLGALGGGCRGAGEEDETSDDADEIVASGTRAPRLCAAMRGNGHYIVTHFASLARIVEHYGVVDGVAGGSSGTVSTFVYESMLMNPAVTTCGGKRCSDARKAARVALALKSVQGYGETVATSEEAVSIRDLVAVAARLKKELDARGIGGLVSTDVALAATKLREVLSIPELKTLVNPEILAMLADPAHLAFNVKEIHTSIVTLGAFSVDDNRLFFRPGILDWRGLGLLFGRVADFYAGYGADRGAMMGFLDRCAESTRGKSWPEAAATDAGAGETCGDVFSAMLSAHRARVRAAAGGGPSRLDERVGGERAALRKLLSTSVLEGDAVTKYRAARATYLGGTIATGSIPFTPAFADIRFGYWGRDDDLARVKAASASSGDLKSKKMTALGNGTWREVLGASPAEPGLSRFVDLPDGRISAGGWSDLAPVLVLKSMGCERVVYVTREGDESPFATKIAKHLGMSESEWKGLYDLGSEDSSFTRSIAAADGVWCTNWNGFTDLQQREMAADAWAAPLEAHTGFAGIRTLAPYDRATARTNKAGCTPGVSAGGTFPR